MNCKRIAMTLMVLMTVSMVVATGCSANEPAAAPQAKAVSSTAKPPVAPAAKSAATIMPVAQVATKPAANGAKPAPASKPATASAPAAEAAKATSNLVLPGKESSPFLTEENFVTKWLVVGPFTFGENDFGGDQQTESLNKTFMPDEAALNGTQKAPGDAKWQAVQFKEGTQAGQCDLDKLYNGIDHAAAYAVCWLNSPADINDAVLKLGSDDYIKVWVNGKQVFAYNKERRGSDWDQDTVKGIQLKKGLNHVVVKVVDVVGGWDFYFRLTDKAENPMVVKAAK